MCCGVQSYLIYLYYQNNSLCGIGNCGQKLKAEEVFTKDGWSKANERNIWANANREQVIKNYNKTVGRCVYSIGSCGVRRNIYFNM